MTRLAIIGAGDLGQLIAHHAPACGDFEVTGFFDDTREVGEVVNGRPILGALSALDEVFATGRFDAFIMGVGYRHLAFRDAFFRRHREAIPAAKLVHPSCILDPSAGVGPGSFLLPGCVLDRNGRVGENCVVNTGCALAHDVVVHDNVFLGPNVTLAGFVTVSGGVFLGVSTTVIDRVSIGSGVQTGGGTVVIDDLTEPGLYVGVPARLVKR